MYNRMGATILFALLLAGCNGSDDDREKTEPRTLEVTSEATEQSSIVSYFTGSSYGPTLDIHHFTDQQTVLLVRITGESTEADNIEAIMHVFAEDTTESAVDDWINNQHSDGLRPNAPEPVRDYTLPEVDYRIENSALIEQDLNAEDGQTYEHYQITYSIDGQSTDQFELNGFSHTTNFYKQRTDSSEQ